MTITNNPKHPTLAKLREVYQRKNLITNIILGLILIAGTSWLAWQVIQFVFYVFTNWLAVVNILWITCGIFVLTSLIFMTLPNSVKIKSKRTGIKLGVK